MCLYRGVSFAVSGPYESFLRVLKSLQSPQNFLEVRIVNMASKGGGDDRLVKGELEFVGFRLAERAEVTEDEAKPDSKSTSHRKRVKSR